METKYDIKKLHKPRKVHKGHSEMFWYNGIAQGKTAKTAPQNPTIIQPTVWVGIPIQQTATTVTYAQPVTILAAVPTQPVVTTSEQHQQFPNFVPYVHPLEDNALTITYYLYTKNGQIQRRKRRTFISRMGKKKKNRKWKIGMVPYKSKRNKELELKQINMKIPKSGPETMSPLETKDTNMHNPQLTDTLVGKTKEISEKGEQKDDSHDSDDCKFFKDDSDDTIDNIV